VHSSDKIKEILPTIISRNKNVFYNDIKTDLPMADILNGPSACILPELMRILITKPRPDLSIPIMPLQQIIERQRLIKTPAEIEVMKQSCSISANAFIEVRFPHELIDMAWNTYNCL